MIYYPLHIIPKIEGESATKVPPALFFVISPRVAVRTGIGFIGLTLLFSVLLPLLAPLGILYFVLVIAAGIYAISSARALLKDTSSRGMGLKSFASLSILRLAISVAILISVIINSY
jgi:hypothetical protein